MTAEHANEKGREAMSAQDYDRAVHFFRQAITAAPDWSAPHYNLGLTYKLTRNWKESRDANRRALELDPEDDATKWNLAISSVALGDWASAGTAFQAIGLELPEGPPPWDFRLGLIPIRVNPDEHPEVVWCHRLDPVRAKLANVPLPESGRRFGDVVLNDGAPRGYRDYKGKEVPVFDELVVLEPSEYGTFEALLQVDDPRTLDGLLGRFEEHMMYAENWTETIRMLCKACSEGRPHEHHDAELEPGPEDGYVRLGVAATDDAKVEGLLKQWPGGRLLRVERLL